MPRLGASSTYQAWAALAALTLSAATAVSATPLDPSRPWTLNRGGYYAESRLDWLSSSSYYDAVGNKVDLTGSGHFKDRSLRMSAEYGIRDRLALALGLPLRFLKQEDDFGLDDANQGFGDARVGLRYRVRPHFDALAGLSHVGGGQNTFAGTALVLGVAWKGNSLAAHEGVEAAGGFPESGPSPHPEKPERK